MTRTLTYTSLLTITALTLACKGPAPIHTQGLIYPKTREEAQKDPLPIVTAGPALGKTAPNLHLVATFHSPAQLVGVAVSRTGRTFLLFPRWGDPVGAPVVELTDEGAPKLKPFPNQDLNTFNAQYPTAFDPALHLVSPQAILIDAKDRLWILDPGSLNFAPHLKNGPKLWCYDINTRERLFDIRFDETVAPAKTFLNDVRIDLTQGKQGIAYVTDSGQGGIITVDLATGKSWRHLDNHPSVLPTPELQPLFEDKPIQRQPTPTSEPIIPDIRSDGIALSPDGKTLYYNALVSHDVYAVPTELLRNPETPEDAFTTAVKKIATKPSGNDGLITDLEGYIYSTDYETNSISRIDPATGEVTTLAQDERLLWPDTLAFKPNTNWLFIATNQLPRGPGFNGGKDLRTKPWSLWKIQTPAPAPTPAKQ